MRKSLFENIIILIFSILMLSLCFSGCKKTENPIKFPKGTFPEDTLINLSDINSAYDDYNVAYQLTGNSPIIFSSNRKSSGGQFDLEQAKISFVFDQTNGKFSINGIMSNDTYTAKLIEKATTPGNDFGPNHFFSNTDGFEYLLLSSVNGDGNLDLQYLKAFPSFETTLPDISGPFPVTILNSASDDAYISFDSNNDSVYFTSDRDGNFDIFLHSRPLDKSLSMWFGLPYSASTKVDIVNSSDDDKCPMIFKNIMFFVSDRPGGLGGFDLYYSVFENGNWNSPINMGPDYNSSSDEYRPVIGYLPDFTNYFIMFSSNRPGGKGGYDLYFSGLKLPK